MTITPSLGELATREQQIAALCELSGREDMQAQLLASSMASDQVRRYLLGLAHEHTATPTHASSWRSFSEQFWRERRAN